MQNDEHPISLELASLRAAVARFQEEAHSASVKLQRYSLDTSNAHDRLLRLERENALLLTEIDVLRRNTTVEPRTSQATQVQELTLSLRRLSDKLDSTEEALFDRTTDLAHAHAEATKAKLTLEGAYALAARVRGREEEGLVRERNLEQRLWEANEQTKQSDRVVNEYANLVRALEGRASGTSSPVSGLSQGKIALEKLFAEFSEETGRLHAEIDRVKHEVDVARAESEAEARNSELDRSELAKIRTEMEKMKLEDNSAAKMVSRYMIFSQTSTNALQESLFAMNTRHAATVDTLGSQISSLSSQLQQSRSISEKMRLALDELGGDLMREAFGRRRETALRIRMVSREEGFEEWVHRWIRRAEEGGDLARMIDDAKNMEMMTLRGSNERLAVVEAAQQTLLDDLRVQTDRRLFLEKLVVVPVSKSLPEPLEFVEDDSAPSESSSSLTLAVSESTPFPTKDAFLDEADLSIKTAFPSQNIPLAPTVEVTPTESLVAFPKSDNIASPLVDIPFSAPEPSQQTPHPLLDELSKVKSRYAEIQRAFRACHLALHDLKQSLHDDNPILQTATERLNDYNEDARVELEIRIADESLQSHGFETLLAIGNVTDDVVSQVEAFVNGEDAAVKKAQKNLEHKLEDIEHDISAIKRAMHDPDLLAPVSPPSRPSSPGPATFGSVMTTRKLKHAQSLNFGVRQSNPYANLGLKVAMPQMRQQPSSPIHMQNAPRARTMSALYTLGFGSRTASGTSRLAAPPPQQFPNKEEVDEDDVE